MKGVWIVRNYLLLNGCFGYIVVVCWFILWEFDVMVLNIKNVMVFFKCLVLVLISVCLYSGVDVFCCFCGL